MIPDLKNADRFRVVTVEGTSIAVNFVHSLNASDPSVLRPSGMVIEVRLVQPSNARYSISSIALLISTDRRAVQ